MNAVFSTILLYTQQMRIDIQYIWEKIYIYILRLWSTDETDDSIHSSAIVDL